jgi:hypothetical protein
MADLEARTASNDARFLSGVCEVVDRFITPNLHLDIKPGKVTTDIVTLDLWGYTDFGAAHRQEWLDYIDHIDHDGDAPDDVTEDFMQALGEFLLPGEKFIVHTVGGEKCRFPLLAYMWSVSKENRTPRTDGQDYIKVTCDVLPYN